MIYQILCKENHVKGRQTSKQKKQKNTTNKTMKPFNHPPTSYPTDRDQYQSKQKKRTKTKTNEQASKRANEKTNQNKQQTNKAFHDVSQASCYKSSNRDQYHTNCHKTKEHKITIIFTADTE